MERNSVLLLGDLFLIFYTSFRCEHYLPLLAVVFNSFIMQHISALDIQLWISNSEVMILSKGSDFKMY